MKLQHILALAGVCLVAGAGLAAAEGAKVDQAAEAATLKVLDKAWSEAAGRKDLGATVAFMADDGETLAPDESVARTKEAIRASWSGLMLLTDADENPMKIGWHLTSG